MFSTNALASSSRNLSICLLVALGLVLSPELTQAQTQGGGTGGSNEEPPPIWYRPGPVTDGPEGTLDTFLCRTTETDASGALYCAGEIGFSALTSVAVERDQPSLFTFVLDTHETVRLESAGALDTRGQLLDVAGTLLAENDNGGDGRNFRMARTLGPGRYYVKITGASGAEGPTTLVMERTLPRHRGARAAFDDVDGDVGNHCGKAADIAAIGRTASVFDHPGDVDVFAVELAEAGELLIDVDGEARYELKAADCTTSLGLANATFGATLVDLSPGAYYLYVSQGSPVAENYEVHLELR